MFNLLSKKPKILYILLVLSIFTVPLQMQQTEPLPLPTPLETDQTPVFLPKLTEDNKASFPHQGRVLEARRAIGYFDQNGNLVTVHQDTTNWRNGLASEPEIVLPPKSNSSGSGSPRNQTTQRKLMAVSETWIYSNEIATLAESWLTQDTPLHVQRLVAVVDKLVINGIAYDTDQNYYSATVFTQSMGVVARTPNFSIWSGCTAVNPSGSTRLAASWTSHYRYNENKLKDKIAPFGENILFGCVGE